MNHTQAPIQPAKRPKTCLCRCRSHCTVFNHSTGQYDGDGVCVTRSTRDNHSRDDKRLDRISTLSVGPSRTRFSRPPPTSALSSGLGGTYELEANVQWLKIAEKEIDFILQFPLVSPTVPLIFENDPRSQMDYSWPTDPEIVRPNFGPHALAPNLRANGAFLEAEGRFCELLSLLLTMKPSVDTESLSDRLYEELHRLHRDKNIQWAQQQAPSDQGRIVVNTGAFFVLWTISALVLTRFSG
jgi:hypothetical protein